MTEINHSESQTGKIERLIYTAKEVREALGGISDVTLWRLIRRGHLQPLPGFRHRMFNVAAVRRFAERGAVS